MEPSLRLGSERICFENGNLISLISNKSSHLEGMAPTLQWGSTRHRGRAKFVFEVNGIYRGNFGLFQAVSVLEWQHVCVFLQKFASQVQKKAAKCVVFSPQVVTYSHHPIAGKKCHCTLLETWETLHINISFWITFHNISLISRFKKSTITCE